MKKFVKGLLIGVGVIALYDLVDYAVTDMRLTKKREEFYAKNGF